MHYYDTTIGTRLKSGAPESVLGGGRRGIPLPHFFDGMHQNALQISLKRVFLPPILKNFPVAALWSMGVDLGGDGGYIYPPLFRQGEMINVIIPPTFLYKNSLN